MARDVRALGDVAHRPWPVSGEGVEVLAGEPGGSPATLEQRRERVRRRYAPGMTRGGASRRRAALHLHAFGGGEDEIRDGRGCAIGRVVLDHRDVLVLRTPDDEALQPADLLEAVEVLRHRPSIAGVAREEMLRVLGLILDLQHAGTDERVPARIGKQSGNEVHTFEHHRPALFERAVDRRLHADEHVARLLEEAQRPGRPRPGLRHKPQLSSGSTA